MLCIHAIHSHLVNAQMSMYCSCFSKLSCVAIYASSGASPVVPRAVFSASKSVS